MPNPVDESLPWQAGLPSTTRQDQVASQKRLEVLEKAPDISPVPWVSVGVEVPFQNSWVYFGAGTSIPGYRMVGDEVEIRGLIKNGTAAAPAFTLPEEYWPANNEYFVGHSVSGVALTYVTNFGLVIISSYAAGGSNAYVSLSGIRYSITP